MKFQASGSATTAVPTASRTTSTTGRRCCARCQASRSTAKVYRAVITPQRVAELLILRPDMPRSLVSSMDEVVAILALVGNQQSAETERQAGRNSMPT
ncbi:alpha-E domain-containing protein [Cupriavidus basilensis]